MERFMSMDITRFSHLLADNPGVKETSMDDICTFMHDILLAEAAEIEKKEPYATKTINALRTAAGYICSCGADMDDWKDTIDCYEPNEKFYTSANPWDAPGMSLKDFF